MRTERRFKVFSRAQGGAFIKAVESTIASIRALVAHLPEEATVGGFGPEELVEELESYPGADHAAVVDYFAFRPTPNHG